MIALFRWWLSRFRVIFPELTSTQIEFWRFYHGYERQKVTNRDPISASPRLTSYKSDSHWKGSCFRHYMGLSINSGYPPKKRYPKTESFPGDSTTDAQLLVSETTPWVCEMIQFNVRSHLPPKAERKIIDSKKVPLDWDGICDRSQEGHIFNPLKKHVFIFYPTHPPEYEISWNIL